MDNLSYIELVASISSCIGIALEKYEKRVFWLFYIASSSLFIYEFYIAKLYASCATQMLYILIAIYGIWTWRKKSDGVILQIDKIIPSLYFKYIFYSILIWVFFYFVSIKSLDANPILDSFILTISLVASYLSCYKYIESWILFIVVGVSEILLYSMHYLIFTSIACIIMTILNINAFFFWQKVFNNNLKVN